MKRLASYALCLIVFACSAPVRADGLKDSLAAIPADAMAFVAVPSVADLDKDYQQAVTKLGLEQFVQPPMNSLIGMLKTFAPMLAGIDESGPVLIVIMPAASIPELQMKQAIILPAKDPKAIIDALGGEAGEGEAYSVNFFGTPLNAVAGKNRVALAMSADVAKAAAAPSAGIDTKLSADAQKALAGLDLIIWLDAQRVLTLARPLIDTMVLPMLTMQASQQGGFAASSAEMNKKNITVFLDGVATMTIGLGLGDAGIGMRFASTTRPGTELAKRTDVKTTTEPLLRGLPSSEFMVALGQTMSQKAVQESVADLKGLIAMGGEAAKADKEKVAKFEKSLLDLITMIASARATVEGLAPGPEGLLGVYMLIETSDSGKWIAQSKEAISLAKQMVADAAKSEGAEGAADVNKLMGSVTYDDSTEKIAGAGVSHLKLDMDKVAKDEEIDEEDLANAKKVLGKDGVLVRVVAVDAKQVLMAFGGGQPRAAAYIEAAKSSGAPLAETQGVKKASSQLPKERAMEMYVAVDNVIRTVQNIQKATDEEVLPIQVPPVNAPVGMSATGGEGWAQYDVFVPTDLMVAIKNAAMTMMGAPAAGAEDKKE